MVRAKKSIPARPWPYQKLQEENATIRAAALGLRRARALAGFGKFFSVLMGANENNKVLRAALVTYRDAVKKYSHAHTDFDPAPTAGIPSKNSPLKA